MDWIEEIKSVFPVGTTMSCSSIRRAIADKHNNPELYERSNLLRAVRNFELYGYAREVEPRDRKKLKSKMLERIR